MLRVVILLVLIVGCAVEPTPTPELAPVPTATSRPAPVVMAGELLTISDDEIAVDFRDYLDYPMTLTADVLVQQWDSDYEEQRYSAGVWLSTVNGGTGMITVERVPDLIRVKVKVVGRGTRSATFELEETREIS